MPPSPCEKHHFLGMYDEQIYCSTLGEGDILNLVCCMDDGLWNCDPALHGPLSVLDQTLNSSRA